MAFPMKLVVLAERHQLQQHPDPRRGRGTSHSWPQTTPIPLENWHLARRITVHSSYGETVMMKLYSDLEELVLVVYTLSYNMHFQSDFILCDPVLTILESDMRVSLRPPCSVL